MAINTKISLYLISSIISSQVVKPDFFVAPATSKTPYFYEKPHNTNSSQIPIQNPIIAGSSCYGHYLMVPMSSA